MNRHFFLGRLCYLATARRAAVMLIALAGSGLGFGDEIHDATARGDLEKVKTLLEGNPDRVSSPDSSGETPLHEAAIFQRKDLAELLRHYCAQE